MNILFKSLVLAGCLLLTSPIEAQDWTRFRGPNGSGLSDAKTVPVTWTRKDINWTVALAGSGNSSPVAWSDKLFVTSANNTGKRFLQCYETARGTELWQKEFEYRTYKKHKNNSYASNTPTVDADHVYVLWQARDSSPLIAFDHGGNEVWRYELGPYLHGQGGGTSPIVFEELVIVFSHCFEGIVGVDPRSGKQNWMIDVFGTFPQRAVGSPIVAGDLIIANSGALVGDKNVVAVRTASTGKKVAVEEVYRVTKSAPHVPTTIVFDKWLFLWNDKGIVSCLEAGTGKKIWQERVDGDYFGSPVCIDGKLYAVDVDGNVVVVSASDEFELLGRTELGDVCRSTPAVHHGTLLIRTDTRLFSIGGKK